MIEFRSYKVLLSRQSTSSCITDCGTLNQFDDSPDDDDDKSDEFYKSKDDLGSPC